MLIQADKELSTMVLEIYHGLAKASLLLEEYQAAENFFFELKNLLKQAKLNKNVVKAYFKGIFYSGMALLYAKKKEYAEANLYLTKAEPIMEYVLSEGSPSAKLLLFTYETLITNSYNNNNYSLALAYAKATRDFHLMREEIFCEVILNPSSGVYTSHDYQTLLTETRQELSELNKKINACKKNAFFDKVQSIKDTFGNKRILKFRKSMK